MTEDGMDPRGPHPAARVHLSEFRAGRIGRREFLSSVTALGLSAATAAGLMGARTASAQPSTPIRRGGTLRIQQEVRPLTDTRAADWNQIANFTRGTLEYLVELQEDGTFRGMLLEGWDASDDAMRYVLRVRPGVRWNNGDPFTSDDVARNIARWCEADVPLNSMAGRMSALIDPRTRRARSGAIDRLDDLTLSLVLDRPDISLVANMADYPAAIVHRSYDPADTLAAVGTGPFTMESLEPGVRGVVVRNDAHDWWGTDVFGGPFLDRIEFVDFGTDPASWIAAFEDGDVDMTYESVGEFIAIMDGMGLVRSETATASTIVLRTNQRVEVDGRYPYSDRRVRKALQLAVDNAICLELGYGGRGEVAGNDHVSPVHPDHAPLPPPDYDPASAREMMQEAGLAEFTHELASVDDEWQRNTADAVAAQLRDAGIDVARTILPLGTYLSNWRGWPFSATMWNHRPLGVQMLALAYRSDAAWNETGFANSRFDALLNDALGIVDAERRREIMAELQGILRDEGVIIQPYWRNLYRHHVAGVVGADIHPTLEIHPYRLGFAD